MHFWTSTLEESIRIAADETAKSEFVKAIADGTLPDEAFTQFLVQDYLYLNAFKTSLLFLAHRLPETDRHKMLEFAYASVEEERTIQRRMMEIFHFDMQGAMLAPITAEYIGFERTAVLSSPVSEALAALLPCFWFYFEVMKQIAKNAVPDNRYQAWIDAYSNPLFEHDTEVYRSLCDKYLLPEEYAKADSIFFKSMAYEHRFWSGKWV